MFGPDVLPNRYTDIPYNTAYFTEIPRAPIQADKISMQNGIYVGQLHAV